MTTSVGNVQRNVVENGPKDIVLLFTMEYVVCVKNTNHLLMLGIGIGPIKPEE